MENNMRDQNPFSNLIDLANERIGGKALLTNDDFFASKNNLVKAAEPVFIPGKYTPKGKWMDGWESRRRRTPGHDWCILKLGVPGQIEGVNVDTTFFTGNYPEHFSLEALYSSTVLSLESLKKGNLQWTEIIKRSPLKSSAPNFYPVEIQGTWSHLRLNIFPDGGVARLRVFGKVKPDWERLSKSKTPLELTAIHNGSKVIACNDNHYGSMHNLILPGRALNMGDGWETKRKRGPGHDWALLELGTTGNIRKIEVDTNHFKGNYPDSCSIEACRYDERNLSPETLDNLRGVEWVEVLPPTKLKAHHRHFFEKELTSKAKEGAFDYVRLNIFPDGGVSRLRAYGFPKL